MRWGTELTLIVDDGWPTPISCRRAASALDAITPARYGDILRAYANAEEARFAQYGPVESIARQEADHCAAAQARAERWKARCLAERAKVARVESLAAGWEHNAGSWGTCSHEWMNLADLRAALADPGDERGQ